MEGYLLSYPTMNNGVVYWNSATGSWYDNVELATVWPSRAAIKQEMKHDRAPVIGTKIVKVDLPPEVVHKMRLGRNAIQT